MICPECHAIIPENKLSCPACLDKRAWRDAVALAASHVPDMAAGRLQLRLAQRFKNRTDWHIALPNHHMSWCGINLRDHKNRNQKKLEEVFLMPLMCQSCITAINQLIEVKRGSIQAH